MPEITEQQILKIRLQAAELERKAADIRLYTARREQESAFKTFAMADAVAKSMFNREMRQP